MAILMRMWVAGLFLAGVLSSAHPQGEYSVKAAYLANLFSYVEWPSGNAGRNSLCVLGRDPFGPELELRIEQYKGGAIVVRRLGEGQSPRECSLLFIAGADLRRYEAAIAEAGRSGVLTVGESRGFLTAGGMLALETDDRDRRVHIKISLDVTSQAGFRISSRLLAIAKVSGAKR